MKQIGGGLDKQFTTVMIDLADYVYLTWVDDINRPGRCRNAVRCRMRDDGITPTQFQDRLVDAFDAGVTQEDLLKTIHQHELNRLLAAELNQ